MNPIAQTLAADYIRDVYPADIPDIQRQHVTQAFIAGMLTAFGEVRKVGLAADKDEEAAVRQLQSIEESVHQFFTNPQKKSD